VPVIGTTPASIARAEDRKEEAAALAEEAARDHGIRCN